MCCVVCCLPLARLLLVRAGSTATASAARLALLLLATLAAHTGLEHERDWRAVGHESEMEGGKEF